MKTALILTISSVLIITGCSAGAHLDVSNDSSPNGGAVVPISSTKVGANQVANQLPVQQGASASSTVLASTEN